MPERYPRMDRDFNGLAYERTTSMKDQGKFSRRSFVTAAGTTALSLGMPAIVPARALGREGKAAASERLTLGFIGMGKQNSGHLVHFWARTRPRCWRSAIATRPAANTPQAGRRALRQGEDQGGEPKVCKGYNDFRELLARNDIDAVVIATPDHWHAIPIIEACKAGKDIYCEKPLTLTIHEAKTVIEAVRKHDRVFRPAASSAPSSTAGFARPASTSAAAGSARSRRCTSASAARAGPATCPKSRWSRASTGTSGSARRPSGPTTRSSARAACTSTSPTGGATANTPAAA